jgi:hypothetical protein
MKVVGVVIIEKRKDVPILLSRRVPESVPGMSTFLEMSVEEFTSDDCAWFDLYDFLSEVFFRGVVLPELRKDEASRDLGVLRRCFDFIELVVSSPVTSISDAGYFQAIQHLFASEDLLLASCPFMRPVTRQLLSADLDTSRISSDAVQELLRYLDT